MIGDRVDDRRCRTPANYIEQIAQLEGCYQPNDAARPLPPCPPRAALGLPEDAVVLCCFNQTYKLSPHMLDLWSRILADAPRTVLWMLAWNPHAKENLLRELAARGVAAGACRSSPTEARPGEPHRAAARGRPVSRHLALQRAHHRQRGAVGRRAGAHRAGPDLRVARRGQPRHGLRPGRPRLQESEDDYVAFATALANEPDTLRGIKAASRRQPLQRCRCSTPSAWRATWTRC